MPHLARVAGALTIALLVLTQTGCDNRPAAPVFSYTLLDGKTSTSEQLRGKVVVVNFWATTCAVCVREMPRFVATHEKFRAHGLETLAVAMSYDPPARVAHYAEIRKLPFGVVIDNTGAIAKGFGNVQATPTTFVIDRQGGIVKRYVGEPDFLDLQALVESLLKQG